MLWKMVQHSFGGGRLDRELMGRQDLAAYFKGASELDNFVVRRQGGISKRRGTDLVCTLGNLSSGARLIPLVQTNEDGYYILLAGGNAYVISKDGIRNTTEAAEGATLWDAALSNASHSVPTGIADAMLDEIDFLQSGDTVFFTHASLPPFKLVFSSATKTLAKETISFSSADASVETPAITNLTITRQGTETTAGNCAFCVVCRESANGGTTFGPYSPASNVVIADYVQGRDGTGNYFTLSLTARFACAASTNSVAFYLFTNTAFGRNDTMDDSLTPYYEWENLNGVVYATPTSGSASATFNWTARSYIGASIARTFQKPFNTDSGNVNITEASIMPTSWKNPYYNGGTPYYMATTDRVVRYVATRVDSNGIEHAPGPATSVFYPLPWPSGGKVTLTVRQSASLHADRPQKFRIYKKESGTYGLVGEIDAADIFSYRGGGEIQWSGTFVDDYITPDIASGVMTRKDHFNAAGDYPSTVALYQQRLVLAGTRNDPFTFWMSVTGDLFSFDEHETLREDDAIEAGLSASEMPEIRHAIMSRDLILFTAGGEWQIAPISGNAISYKTVSAKMQSAIGSARWTKPILIGEEIVFVDGSGENLMATKYSYASDGYEAKDLTIMSRWIFQNNGIRRICYRRNPDSEILCVLGDGTVAALAYMTEHDVCAWSRHELAAGYRARDCASSKAISNGASEVMLLVSNAEGTSWEAWRLRDDCPVRESPTVGAFVCMDRCHRKTVAEGETYSVPAGMTSVNTATASVAQGGTALPPGDYIVGHPFVSRLVTVHPEPQGQNTVQMEIKNPTEVEVRVIDASTFSVGAADAQNHLRQVPVPVTASGGTVSLGNADARLPVCGRNTRDGRMTLVHAEPFPLTLTSIATTYQIEDANAGGGNG